MAFNLQFWGTVSTTTNSTFIVAPNGVHIRDGAPAIYSYAESNLLANIVADDYFVQMIPLLCSGDFIQIDAIDGVGLFYVSHVNSVSNTITLAEALNPDVVQNNEIAVAENSIPIFNGTNAHDIKASPLQVLENVLKISVLTQAEIDALVGVENGRIVYNSTTNKFNVYEGGAWTPIVTGTTNGVTSITQAYGIACTPNPIVATGTIALANLGTAGTVTHPTSMDIDGQGRVSAYVSGAVPVTSVVPGNGIFISGAAPNPEVSLATVGTPGTVTNPSSMDIDLYGRVSAYTSGSAPVTSVSGSAGNITSTGGTTPVLNLATVGSAFTGYSPYRIIDTFGRTTTTKDLSCKLSIYYSAGIMQALPSNGMAYVDGTFINFDTTNANTLKVDPLGWHVNTVPFLIAPNGYPNAATATYFKFKTIVTALVSGLPTQASHGALVLGLGGASVVNYSRWNAPFTVDNADANINDTTYLRTAVLEGILKWDAALGATPYFRIIVNVADTVGAWAVQNAYFEVEVVG